MAGISGCDTIGQMLATWLLTTDDSDARNRLFARLSPLDPVAYAEGLSVTNPRTTVTWQGNVYIARPDRLPFTTGAELDPLQWRMILNNGTGPGGWQPVVAELQAQVDELGQDIAAAPGTLADLANGPELVVTGETFPAVPSLINGQGDVNALNASLRALAERDQQLRDELDILQGPDGAAELLAKVVPSQPSRAVSSVLSSDVMISASNYLTLNPTGDVRAQIQAALNEAAGVSRAGRREVVFRARGVYQISDVLLVPSGVRLIFDGEGRFMPLTSSTSLGSSNGLRSYGALPSTTYPLTADVSFGAFTIPAGVNARLFAPGDYVWLASTARIDTSPNTRDITKAQMAKVVAVEGENLILDRLAEYDYAAANSTFGKPTIMQNVRVEGFKFGDPTMAVRSGRGLDFRFHDNLSILDSDIGWSRPTANVGESFDMENVNSINLMSCSNTIVDGFRGERVGWYGVCVDGASHNVVVRNAAIRIARHGVSLNWNGPGEPRHVKVCDSESSRTSLAGFDTHDVGRFILFENLLNDGGNADGFQFRTNDCTGRNLVAYGCPFVGVRIYAHTDAAAAQLKGINLENIRAQRCGVGVSGIAPYNIRNFLIDSCTSAGITTMGGSVVDGTITDCAAAIIYQPAPSPLAARKPLTIDRVTAPASAIQTHFLRSTRTYAGAGLRIRDCDVAGYPPLNRITRTDGNTFIVDIDHKGCAWGTGVREGTVTLVAGTASVANDNVFSSGSTPSIAYTATGVFRSHATLQRLTTGAGAGGPGVLTAVQADGVLTINSNVANDVGIVEWRIL